MNKYHIFAIKKEIYNIYKNNSYSLYKVLYNLYKINKPDLNYGITLYNQICYPINVFNIKPKFLLLENIKIDKNKYILICNNKKSLIIFKPSRIIYKTDKIESIYLFILNEYYNYFFACDFDSNSYFWINKIKYWINYENLVKY